MIFNSVTFLLFLLVCVVLYWLLPHRLRIWLIFLSGLVFYGFWRVEFIPIMLFTAFVDYFVALKINRIPVEHRKQRLGWLIVSFVVNFGLLLYFKYLLFFTANLNALSASLGLGIHIPYLHIILPLGISFYTFESVCYTVDVYRGHLKPNRDWVLYGGFITFFPKLIAGPILRASEILHQLRSRPPFQWSYIGDGLHRILMGLFLKVVIADNISSLVDEGYLIPADKMSALDVWTLAFLFGFQIYFDFSGYSHIAIGCGKMMGVHISENFNFPYMAVSFKDFWKRWHISLSTWIRDYLYLPLLGKKVANRIGSGGNVVVEQENISELRKDGALFLTWAIMGFWHGANWTFLVWGLYHATMIFLERLAAPIRKRLFRSYPAFLGWAVTLPFAMLAWVPFRAQTMQQTLSMLGKVLQPSAYTFITMRENTYLMTFVLLLMAGIAYVADRYIQPRIREMSSVDYAVRVIRMTVLLVLVFTFLRPISQFIYFQF